MNVDEAFRSVEQKGLLKTSSGVGSGLQLSSRQKVQLNRKGNELFNNKNYNKAESIFLLTKYSDGLCRMGDYYYENENPVKALEMYFKAKMPSKYEPLLESVAGIIKEMIS